MIKKLWQLSGFMAFWLASPLLFIYLRIGSRTRIVVYCDEAILVVKGWLGDGKWALPGGGLHYHEAPLAGVVRELHEETGVTLRSRDIQPLGEAQLKKGLFWFKYSRFYAQVLEQPALRRQKWEIVEVAWIPLNELNVTNSEQTLLDTIQAWKDASTSVTM